MKKLITILAAIVLAACSVSEGDRTRDMIEDYLKKNTHDPASVELISVGELIVDSASRFEGTALYQTLEQELKDAEASAEEYKGLEAELYNEYSKEAENIRREIAEYKSSFKPFFFWYSDIDYRAKNAFGALVKSRAKVKFNQERTEILEFKETED